MSRSSPLVSIGMPVRNGADRLAGTVKSVLAQDYDNLELVISDNASTDGTEEICRELARADRRVTYHRHPVNLGIFGNFNATVRLAQGSYFRWIGHDDQLEPSYVSRCLAAFAEDEQRVLVSTQIAYEDGDGPARTACYDREELSSHDPVVRFREMLRLLDESYLLIDPLYSLIRRDTLLSLPRRNLYNEDQVLAARLALAGPWGHVPEVLASRPWAHERRSEVARKIDVPVWQVRVATALVCRELLRYVRASDLDPVQRRQARSAVTRFYLRRHRLVASRRIRRLGSATRVRRRPSRATEASG